MKIGFPASGLSVEEKHLLSNDFVEGGIMGVYDTTTKTVEVVEKESLGKGLLRWVSEKGIEAIITPELKAMALRAFRGHGISVFKAEGRLLALNIELLLNKNLNQFSLIEMSMENDSCSSTACSSCSSSCG